LQQIRIALASADLPPSGRLADFGCSNGFIIEELQRYSICAGWTFDGFDHNTELLRAAIDKRIPHSTFSRVDLNAPESTPSGLYDLVLCLETLEHTGNYRNAAWNVLRACAPGGHVLITVPNETGVPGLVKFFARSLLRDDPYGDFFTNKSRVKYTWRLLTSGDLEGFREPPRPGWGPHLGFDVRRFEQWVAEKSRGDFASVRRWSIAANFNRMYLFKRLTGVA